MDTGIIEAPRRKTEAGRPTTVKRINLALQGGGAHGAFTWGVLDRLLEDERVAIEGISATSAGAMNAAVLAYGIAEGGPAAARKALANFWRRVSHAARFSPVQRTPLDRLTGNTALDTSPAWLTFDLMTRVFSPYQLNPLNHHPLRHVLEQSIDFSRLSRSHCALKLFLSATNVRTGKIKVFQNDDITGPDPVLASGCLPFLFQAVEVDGEHYWDGGYMGNPAIYPLIYHCDSRDVVVVHVNPIERPDVPTTAAEIMNRINEISFNSSLMREMRAISFVTRLVDEQAVGPERAKRMLIHAIAADEVMRRHSVASKLHADWDFLIDLREAGRAQAGRWLDENFDRLNVESTVDIRARYL